jgi:hypothetical protein
MTTVDVLTAISAHLAEFELPPIASVHVAGSLSTPQVTVQLACHEPSTIARGAAGLGRHPHRGHRPNLAGSPG